MMKYIPRMTDWVIYAAILLGIVYYIAPQNLPVVIHKLSLVALAGLVGYRMDYSLFPYARPDKICKRIDADKVWGNSEAIVFSVCMLRRAIIVGSIMIAVALGI